MARQTFFPNLRDIGPHNSLSLGELGRNGPMESCYDRGKEWNRGFACRDENFALNVYEGHGLSEWIGYTKQDDYLKVNFWLAGRHTTVLHGYRQHEHDRPEVFITAGPAEMVKVDLFGKDTHIVTVALCVRRDFFPQQMGIQLDELPEPLRAIVVPETFPYSFHRIALTPDLFAAARSILTAPFAVLREGRYVHAKAIELMYLLINRLSADHRTRRMGGSARSRREASLYEARELLTRNYAQSLTLERISREVGLNRGALTSGFRQLFGMSVQDFLRKVRMEHAHELLQNRDTPINQVAEAVGFSHSCNFSTAFHEYFGCTPQQARRNG